MNIDDLVSLSAVPLVLDVPGVVRRLGLPDLLAFPGLADSAIFFNADTSAWVR